MIRTLIILVFFTLFLISCEKPPPEIDEGSLTSIEYNPTFQTLEYPDYFIKPNIPTDNPQTIQGIQLGRRLFYDPILSRDSTLSCASCHEPSTSFTDLNKFSIGIDGFPGNRTSMSLINTAFIKAGLFWDGRSKELEAQALLPIEDPLELHHQWPTLVNQLKNHPTYPSLFRQAFGITNKSEITKELAAKALAQFERTLIHSDSKFDKVMRQEVLFSDMELIGFLMYIDDDPDLPDAECGHCHTLPMATADQFFNNGLDLAPTLEEFKDKGLGKITGNRIDNGKFKAPTLRNIMLTPPYMHDGRFQTIDEVLTHYNSGGHDSPNKDPLIRPLGLTPFQLNALKAFLHTLTDTSFLSNPDFQRPE